MKAILIKYYKHFSLVKMPKMLKKKNTPCVSVISLFQKKKVVGNQLVTCSSKKTELCAELRFSFPMIILGIQTNSNVTNINVFSADNKTKTMIMEGRQESVAAHICLFTIKERKPSPTKFLAMQYVAAGNCLPAQILCKQFRSVIGKCKTCRGAFSLQQKRKEFVR